MLVSKLEKALFFLTILLLPTQLGRHFWPDFSFLYSLKIDYFSPTLYFWDLLFLFTFFIFLLQRKKLNLKALNLYLFFILTQLLSILFNSSNSDFSIGPGLVKIEQYAIAGLFGVYIASLHLQKIKRTFFLALSLSILVVSILGIGQFLKGGTLGFWILGERSFSISTPGIAKFDFYANQFLRPYSIFSHPNVLAAFLVLGIILLYFLKEKTGKYLTIFVVVSALTTLLLTVSRAVLIAAFLSSFLLLQKKWFLLTILTVVLASPFLYPRFSSVFNFDNLTVLRREELSQRAIHHWISSPWFGIGLNNFILATAGDLIIGPSRFLQPVHNIFLLSLSETGLVGLLGLLGLLLYAIIKIVKIRPLLVCWLIIIFLGLFDHYFLTLPQGYRMFFLIWGISLSMLE